jgi:hypothetical protein
MAIRTVSNAGGNWNATATWVGAVVPIAGDSIAFTATSGNLTVNVASAGLVGVNFTNYVGTITFNNTITTNGVLNLGTGGYTQAGASGILLNGTATLTSGGVTWSRPLAFGGASATYTLVDNWTVTGAMTFQGSGTTTFTNNTLNINGSLTQTTTGTYSGTTAIVFGGTGTWSNSSTGVLRNNTTVNTAGTLTISGNVYYDTGTLTYTAGTVTTTGSTLNVAAATTFATNGITWNNVTVGGSTNYTITLSNNLTIGGNFTFSTSGTSTVTMNGNTMNIGGNFTFSGNSVLTGTTAILLNGTGTWSNSSTGVLRNNTTVSTAGTLTISGNVYYNTGTLTYTAGTVTTTGSTLTISLATNLNTNGITWNNITATGVMTLGSNLTLTGTLTTGASGTLSFVLGGFNLISTNANLTIGLAFFTMPANQTFKTLTVTSSSSINANTLTITENLTINNTVSGSTNIIYAGTGTWTALNSSSYINNVLTINTAGTLTISGIVYKQTGLFTYTAGTIIDTTGTVAVSSLTLNLSLFTFRKLLVTGAITLTSNLNATTFGTWSSSSTSFVLGGNSLNFTHLELGNIGSTTLPTAWVCQNIEFVTGGVLNANSITINGNILQSSNGGSTGTTTFTYAGTGTWTSIGTGYLGNNFTINTAGTLTFISAGIGGGIFTYTAGTVITTGSTLTIRNNGTIMNHGAIVWHDVTTTTNVISFILNNQLVCLNALTIEQSQVNFSGTNGTFDVYYLNLNSSGTVARNPRLVATKTYRVRAGFTSLGTLAFPITLSSTIGGSQAIFTLDSGSTIDVGFVNATDINSSLGRTVYSYRGVFSNTLNWSLLPVDITTTAFTFIS